MRKYELSLAENYVQDWTITDAIREYFQNALDQETVEPDNKMFFNYDKEEQKLQIGNKKSVLSAKSLLLGTTTKADNDKVIGQFGEGYKIATLVALRCGKHITFYNYGKREIWTPKMVKSRRYEGAEILTFFVDKFIWSKPPHNNLIIEVMGITEKEYEDIIKHNLHLTDRGKVYSTPKGDILCDEQFKGKIFTNGLYIRTEPRMQFGYDIKPQFLKLDRDRKMVSSFDLQWFTSTMWADTRNTDLVEVAKSGAPDVQYLGTQTYVYVPDHIKQEALEDFRTQYGDTAIPVSKQHELEEAQESYVDAKPVLVPETYKRLVTESIGYEVKAQRKTTVTKEEQLLQWVEGIKDKISHAEYLEFIAIVEPTPENIEASQNAWIHEETPF